MEILVLSPQSRFGGSTRMSRIGPGWAEKEKKKGSESESRCTFLHYLVFAHLLPYVHTWILAYLHTCILAYLLTGTVPVNNSLLSGILPVNNSLVTGTIRVNNPMERSCSGKWFPIDLSFNEFDYLVVCKGAMYTSIEESKCATYMRHAIIKVCK